MNIENTDPISDDDFDTPQIPEQSQIKTHGNYLLFNISHLVNSKN